MKLSLSAMAAALTGFALFAPGTAAWADTLINFSEFSGVTLPGADVGNFYNNKGIDFTNTFASNFWGNASPGGVVIGYTDADVNYDGDSGTGIAQTGTFVAPGTMTNATTNSLSLQTIFEDGGTTATVTVYGVGGSALDMQTIKGDSVFTFNDAGMHSFSLAFSNPNGDDVIGFSNVRFGTLTPGSSSTPEPGAYAMLGSLGLAGAAFLRRRRAR